MYTTGERRRGSLYVHLLEGMMATSLELNCSSFQEGLDIFLVQLLSLFLLLLLLLFKL